jgi:hypothetical protein
MPAVIIENITMPPLLQISTAAKLLKEARRILFICVSARYYPRKQRTNHRARGAMWVGALSGNTLIPSLSLEVHK